MAICGRCGWQTESAGEDCPYCSEYATAGSPVGAYSGSASRASYGAAGGHRPRRPDPYSPTGDYSPAGDDGRSQFSRVEPEFAALPPCERPFAAEHTVWPAALPLAATPAGLDAPDDVAIGELPEPEDDLAIGELPEPQNDLAIGLRPEPEDDLAIGEQPEPEDVTDGAADQLQLPDLNSHGRWIALTVATMVVLIAAAGAVTLVVHSGRTSQSGTTGRPGVTASPSASAPPSAAPAGQSQLIVDPAAATAPAEAAMVASVNHYFDAINNHSYLSYKRTFILALRGGISSASFSARFGTTAASDEQLRSVSVVGAGKVDALVSLISQQPTAGHPGAATCTAWSVELYLGRRGGRYLLVAQPLWYQASRLSCL